MLTPPPPRRAYLSTSQCTKSSYFEDRGCEHIRKKCAVVAYFVWVTSLLSNNNEEFINYQRKGYKLCQGFDGFSSTRQHLGTWGEVEKSSLGQGRERGGRGGGGVVKSL